MVLATIRPLKSGLRAVMKLTTTVRSLRSPVQAGRQKAMRSISLNVLVPRSWLGFKTSLASYMTLIPASPASSLPTRPSASVSLIYPVARNKFTVFSNALKQTSVLVTPLSRLKITIVAVPLIKKLMSLA